MRSADLPVVRSHERIDYKRCPKKWYWKWRVGLVPKEIKFGALDLGTWVHAAKAAWYGKGFERNGSLLSHFSEIADAAMHDAANAGAPEYVLDKAEEIALLGEAMMAAYERRYGDDPGVNVIAAELPLEFTIPDETGKIIAVHRLKPDLVYADPHDDVWLMEHKTAATIRLEHLVIDDQARPYGAMAERALRKLGLIAKRQIFKGIMYNYLRKGLPDEREVNSKGQALNKDGSISKRQPSPLFVRHPVKMTRAAKMIALERIRIETILITLLADRLRKGEIIPQTIPKTPHNSCPKTCQFFTMCVSEEQGADIREMQQRMYTRANPYLYDEEFPTTDEPKSFEMG